MMENKYVLMVCPILKDNKDFAGNPYRGVGEFIQAKTFVKDGNIDTGLYGILWGKCGSNFRKEMLKFDWAVIKTEINENLLTLDKIKNEAKFKRGIILHIGKIQSCADYVLRIKDDEQQFFAEEASHLRAEDIIGSKEWFQKQTEKSYG